MGPNIAEDVRIEGFAFVAYGDYSSPYVANIMRGNLINPVSTMLSEDRQLRPIIEHRFLIWTI
ncbi:MAG: hypothetical protein FWE34_04855 [Defluviitaleaceae bacterium]|nr:hypothetical protein [Defluviitaleaceae bacterium]